MYNNYVYTRDIRAEFWKLLRDHKYTEVFREGTMTGLMGNRTVEIVNASFIANEGSIFGELNHDYIKREAGLP